jgi:hypothetical protein
MVAQRLFQLGLAGILGFICATMAQAAELQPVEANVTTLGPVSVITYYTAGPQGLEVVATAQVGEADTAVPLRFTATLAPSPRVAISVPQGPGEPPLAVELARIGDRLEVTRTPAAGIAQLIR